MPLPAAARAYLCLMALSAMGVLGLGLRSGPVEANLVALGQLVVLAVVAQHFPLEMGPKRKFDVSIAVHLTILLVAGLPLAIALVGAAEALG